MVGKPAPRRVAAAELRRLAESLFTAAGAKGAGLSLMIECLASLTDCNPVLAPALRGELGKDATRMNGLAMRGIATPMPL